MWTTGEYLTYSTCLKGKRRVPRKAKWCVSWVHFSQEMFMALHGQQRPQKSNKAAPEGGNCKAIGMKSRGQWGTRFNLESPGSLPGLQQSSNIWNIVQEHKSVPSVLTLLSLSTGRAPSTPLRWENSPLTCWGSSSPGKEISGSSQISCSTTRNKGSTDSAVGVCSSRAWLMTPQKEAMHIREHLRANRNLLSLMGNFLEGILVWIIWCRQYRACTRMNRTNLESERSL